MTGNIAMDVFIGLVFIYLLYSLYATIIMELIATLLGLRARNLSYAVRRMLRDEKQFKFKISKLLSRSGTAITNFYGKSLNLKSSKLFDDFYKQPLIKYLSSGSFFNRPSYLDPGEFSKALVDSLKGNSKKPNLLEKIKETISKLPEDSDTKKHLQSLLEDASDDIQHFRLLLENWFDSTMKRVIGWYKRKTQFLLLIIGFLVAVIFNASTFQIVDKLSKDDKAREQLVNLATSYIEENSAILNNLDSIKQLDSSFHIKLDTLLSIREDLLSDINEAKTIVNINWPRIDSIKIDTIPKYFSKGENLRQMDKKMVIITKKYPVTAVFYPVGIDKSIFIKSLKKEKNGKKVFHLNKVKSHVMFNKKKYFRNVLLKNFWGFLVTALAISLGAPFWFDLLNKFIQLRGSIKQTTKS